MCIHACRDLGQPIWCSPGAGHPILSQHPLLHWNSSGCLARESQESACLPFPSTGIISVHHYIWIFKCCFGASYLQCSHFTGQAISCWSVYQILSAEICWTLTWLEQWKRCTLKGRESWSSKASSLNWRSQSSNLELLPATKASGEKFSTCYSSTWQTFSGLDEITHALFIVARVLCTFWGGLWVYEPMLSISYVWDVRDVSSACRVASGTAPMWLIVTILSMGCSRAGTWLGVDETPAYSPQLWGQQDFWIHSALPRFCVVSQFHLPHNFPPPINNINNNNNNLVIFIQKCLLFGVNTIILCTVSQVMWVYEAWKLSYVHALYYVLYSVCLVLSILKPEWGSWVPNWITIVELVWIQPLSLAVPWCTSLNFWTPWFLTEESGVNKRYKH